MFAVIGAVNSPVDTICFLGVSYWPWSKQILVIISETNQQIFQFNVSFEKENPEITGFDTSYNNVCDWGCM